VPVVRVVVTPFAPVANVTDVNALPEPKYVKVSAVELDITGAEENVLIPFSVCAKSDIINEEFAAVSGIVYVREVLGAGEVIVVVFVIPNTI
jgi:hypothetical protein